MDEKTTDSKTPHELKEDIKLLCNANGMDNAFYVVKRPKFDCDAGNCFTNVEKYVGKFGGSLLMGWKITVRTNLYIEGEAHAVWQTPEKEIVDITPDQEEYDRILFSSQESMSVCKTPSKYVPITSSALVQEYIALKNTFESIRCGTTDGVVRIPKQLVVDILTMDGVFASKTGRNDKCPCQSGLKYKLCCGQ